MNKSEPKVVKREPIGSQREPKRSPKGAKGSQNGAKERPKCIKKSSFGKGRENERQGGARVSTGVSILATIFDQKSKKWYPKRHPKIDAEKVWGNYGKRVKNHAQINDFSYLFKKT